MRTPSMFPRLLPLVVATVLAIGARAHAQTPQESPASGDAPTPSGQSVVPAPDTPLPAPKAKADGIRVSILGYHDFSQEKKATAMLLPTETFRKQMQAIRDLGLSVISMEDFTAWKRGEKSIPDKSIVITIDDGWKSVYTDAFPILKEFGYPFTVFLYQNYVDGGNSALTTSMIKEMQKHGCTVGSHSVSHPYPATVKAERAKGSDSFATYLRKEMGGSKKFLQQKFGGKVNTYAYPGGFFTGEMLPIASEVGYEFLFTVLPGKVTSATSNFTIPRYVILGTHDHIFRDATRFKATSTSAGTDGAIVQTLPHPVTPEPGALISNRLPEITADLSKVENIDVESITMRVAGFGKVPATFDAENKVVSWKVTRRLRAPTCEVTVQWRNQGATSYEKPMTWIFRVNREAAYQPQ